MSMVSVKVSCGTRDEVIGEILAHINDMNILETGQSKILQDLAS